jgi:hypothetical protein
MSDKRPKRNRAADDPERVLALKNALVTEGSVKAACEKVHMDKDTAKTILEKYPMILPQALLDNRQAVAAAKEAAGRKFLEMGETMLQEGYDKRDEIKSVAQRMTMGAILVDKANVMLKAEEEKQIQMSVKAVQELFKTAEELGREIERRSLKPVIDVEKETIDENGN